VRVHAAASDDGAVGGLLGSVFAVDPPKVEWPDSLAAVEAADPESECRAIARWAKGHMAAGIRSDELAVVGRRTADFDATLHRVFAEAGLPPPPCDRSLAATPAGRMLVAAVAVADRFDSADVLRVLGSSYLDPSRLGGFDESARDAAQLIIRQQNVMGRRDRYGQAVERVAARLETWAGSREETFLTPQQRYLAELGPAAVAAAGQLLEALFACIDPIAAGGAPTEMAAACRQLMDTVIRPSLAVTSPPHCGGSIMGQYTSDVPPAMQGAGNVNDDDAMAADDLRTWSALCAVLDDLAEATDVPGASRRLTPGEFGAVLSALLAETPARPAAEPTAIGVVGALDARAVRARHIWLVGLNEGVFPVRPAEAALIGETDRRAWAEQQGLRLDLRDELTAREMLLLYLTISRADEGLTISWRAADSAAHTTAPSGFVDALLAATDPATRKIVALPMAEFAPPPGRIVSQRELINAAMAAAADRGGGNDTAWRAARSRGLLASLARPLWAAHRRWAPAVVDRYDGVLDDPTLVEAFSRRIPAETVLSVSQINTYLDCPWRWFAERSLQLAELTTPSDELLPRGRGQLVHAILRRLFAGLSESGDVPVAVLTDDAVTAALDAAIEAEAASVAGPVECRGLWMSELRRVRRDLLAYLQYQAGSALPNQRVSKQELAFGMQATAGDPASTSDPLVLDSPAGPVRLRGMIDRVDWVEVDGQPRPFVIDYKTGKLPDVDADAQLPVYIKAAEWIFDTPAAGGAVQAIGGKGPRQRDLARLVLSRGKLKTVEDYPARLAAALDNLHRAVEGMAAGRFGVADVHGCAGSWCPLRRICGYSEARARVKAPVSQEGDDE